MIEFVSTKKGLKSSLKEAVLRGFAPDGSLYLPSPLPTVAQESLRGLSFQEMAIKLSEVFFKDDISLKKIENVVHRAFSFPLPLIPYDEGKIFGLELFHGPTLSFKDFGARYMAELTLELLTPNEKVLVLVATTGDTGSAVGEAFRGKERTAVVILFPKGKVTPMQEKQLTSIGDNVFALEIEGSFDDCQRLLQKALSDPELKKNRHVTTGNSINVARIIPQSFYYFYAILNLPQKAPPVVAVPSGNFGHLVSGILARKMGLPVARFLAVTNINDEVPVYLETGIYTPHPSLQTIASSMDVGNPSNFPRLCALYDWDLEKMRRDILGMRFTDEEIAEGIRELFFHKEIVLEPHSMTGYLALKRYFAHLNSHPGVFVETAHPSKFGEVVENIIGKKIPLPARLEENIRRPKQSMVIPNTYLALKEVLLAIAFYS